MDSAQLVAHRGKIFTLIADPTHSEDLPFYRDCYRVIDDGALLVDPHSGVIVAVGEWKKLRTQAGTQVQMVDHRPHWLFPGFVDVHTHLPQLPVAGRGGLHLQEWLKRYIFPAEARFADLSYAQPVIRAFFKRLARVGTTTAVVMTTIHKAATERAFEEARGAGLRIFMGKMLMDMNAPDDLIEPLEKGLAESVELCETWHDKNKGLLQYLFSPRFAITCSKKLMEKTGEVARAKRVGVHTHLNETRGEISSVGQIHPWADHYTDVYVKTGLIASNHLNIVAHQIYPKSKELKSLLGFPLCTAHCPTANAALRSGEFDMLNHYSHGLDRVGLGSDVGAGPSLSLFDVMRAASQISKNDLNIFQLFYLATLGGARALGVPTGALMEGREADFLVLNPEAVNPFAEETFQSLEEMLLVLVSRGGEFAGNLVMESYVRGNRVYSPDF